MEKKIGVKLKYYLSQYRVKGQFKTSGDESIEEKVVGFEEEKDWKEFIDNE